MKKSTMLLGFFFLSNSVFVVKNIAVKSQNKIDEKRNVKQPPELLKVQTLVNQFIPAIAKLFQKAFLHRQFSRDHHLYSPVPFL